MRLVSKRGIKNRVKNSILIYQENKKKPSRCYNNIVSDSYTSYNGLMWLVRGMYIVVLLIYKGASVYPFVWNVSYDTKTTSSCCCCIGCSVFFYLYRIVGLRTGSTKPWSVDLIISYDGKGWHIEIYWQEDGRYSMGLSWVHWFQLGFKLVVKHVKNNPNILPCTGHEHVKLMNTLCQCPIQ